MAVSASANTIRLSKLVLPVSLLPFSCLNTRDVVVKTACYLENSDKLEILSIYNFKSAIFTDVN